MGPENRREADRVEAMYVEIRLAGQLPRNWTDWCEGFTCLVLDSGESILTGPVADQAALMGLLSALSHMNLTLLSVKRLDRSEP